MVIPRPAEVVVDPTAPDYEPLPGGGLVVSYRPQTIRHHKRGSAGSPIELACSRDGEFEIEWRIHASNLSRPRSGVATIQVEWETRGDPIESLHDLREVLGTEVDDVSAEEAELESA